MNFITIFSDSLGGMLGYSGVYNHLCVMCQYELHMAAHAYNYEIVSFAENGIVVKLKQ